MQDSFPAEIEGTRGISDGNGVTRGQPMRVRANVHYLGKVRERRLEACCVGATWIDLGKRGAAGAKPGGDGASAWAGNEVWINVPEGEGWLGSACGKAA